MAAVGVVASMGLLGFVAWRGVAAAKTKWQGAGGRGGTAYQMVP